jgi:hypothetical protein
MRTILIAAAVALCAAVAVPATAHKGGKGKHKGQTPDVIELPTGFQPEGITTSKRHTFFVGSRDSGAIYKGDLRTGEGATLVPGDPDPASLPDDRGATGLKVDRYGRLFASGANTQHIRVYDASTGAEIRVYPVPGAGFINDVIITRQGAYFTDSNNPRLYFIPFGEKGALGELRTITVGGEFAQTPGFNLNGIEQARGGKTLILIKSMTGELFTADAVTSGATAAKKVPVTGGDGEIDEGDGIMRKGRKLYVVENQDDRVTVVRLSRNLSEGRIVREIDSDLFEVPTTIARSGGRNYVGNAKFNRPNPDNSFEVVKVPKK